MSVLANSLKHESHELSLLDLKGVKLKVMRVLHNTYMTRRELSEKTGLRISTLCSALKRLEDEGWVRIAFDALDIETNRNVACYTSSAAADIKVELAAGVVERHWLGEPDGE